MTKTMQGLHDSVPKSAPSVGSSSRPGDGIALAVGPYLLRTLTADDATDRCATWFSDPYVRYMINSPAKEWTKDAVVKYINQFDQASKILLGIFDAQQQLLVGFLTAKINRATRQGLITTLVGESAYRYKGVLSAVRIPFYDYLFDTLRLKMLLASVLPRNAIHIEAMLKHGWKLDQTLKNHVKSNADGTMLDLCLFSLTRDAHRAWKKANRPQRTKADAGKSA
jgi:RimJ/RimL family protein N-acetyltransferase